MDILSFIAAVIGHIASWPVVIVVLLVVYRPQIKNLPLDKILDRIKKISHGKTSVELSPPATPGEQPVQEDMPKEARNIDASDWKTPQDDWTSQTYKDAFFHAVIMKDAESAKNISDAFLSSAHAQNEQEQTEWSAFTELWRIRFGMWGDLNKLKRLAEDKPDSSYVMEHLARGLEQYDDYKNAAEAYKKAAEKSSDNIRKVEFLGRAAVAYNRAGLSDESLSLLTQAQTLAQKSEDGEKELLKIMQTYAELTDQSEAFVAVMERLIELDPSGSDTRFQLAYKHSQLGNNDLALFHYTNIPSQERSQMAWNNLGVSYGNFDLASKATAAFRTAEAMGETLAMSNLADRLVGAGFLDEAQKLCEKAGETKDYHKNVDRTLARIKSIPEAENEKVQELLKKTKPVSDFYKKLGKAISLSQQNDIAGIWEGPDCQLTITVNGTAFTAKGSYEQKASALGSLFFGLGGLAGNTPPTHYTVEYKGTIYGHGVDARVNRIRDGEARTSLLSEYADSNKVLMVVSESGDVIDTMERTKDGGQRFYSFKKT